MKYLIILSLLLSACTVDDNVEDEAFTEHGESSDFEVVIQEDGKGDEFAARFDEDSILSDRTFTDSARLNAAQIQTFLEATPYGRSSWLARERVNGRPASRLISETAREYGLNPIVLLTRFQVEGSHISKSRRPGNFSVNRALGCGCFDGSACQSRNLGLKKQLSCAAKSLRKGYDSSVSGTGAWVKLKSRRTLDPMRVTPESHATAALYAYTPWVLRGRGGNWLVWNITQRFLSHVPSAAAPHSPTVVQAWVGSPCTRDNQCDFTADGSPAFCFNFEKNGVEQGVCTLPCEGYCPDKEGEPLTFCVRSDVDGIGICAERVDAGNSFCGDNPATEQAYESRFIGTSNARSSTKNVCLPTNL